MNIPFKAAIAAVALWAVQAAPANAAITVDSSACVSVATPQGCLFNGNLNGNPANQNGYVAAQNAYNIYNDVVTTAAPDIVLNYLGDTNAGFPGTFTNPNGLNGTWTLGAGLLVDYLAVKSSNRFILYKLPTPLNSGNWSTAGLLNQNGQQQELSHLVFFGNQAAVPEPMTWIMMIMGFGLVGGALRRRNTRSLGLA
ncbi:MAG: PEPxxWA-CTERM sorting domain-containing protein [Sphingorhabdus sp.]